MLKKNLLGIIMYILQREFFTRFKTKCLISEQPIYFCFYSFLKSRIDEIITGKIRIGKLGVPYYTLPIRYKVWKHNFN